MKTVVVFCAENKNVQNTRNIIRNTYANSPVNVIYTGAQNKNNIRKLLLPIAPNSNRNTFNRNLTSLLGGRKANMFIFEGCPLGFIHQNAGGRLVSGGTWNLKQAGINKVNHNIVNVVRKHSKNNAILVSPGPWLNVSRRLIPKNTSRHYKYFKLYNIRK